MVKPLSSMPAGRTAFVDANVFHFYLRGPEVARKAAVKFLERVESKEISGYTSVLVLDELAYKILLRKIEEKHKQNPLIVIEKDFAEIGKHSSYVKEAVDIIMGISGLVVLDVTKEDLQHATDIMELFSLLPRDALHLSVMLSYKINDLVSSDKDFDRVKDLTRWAPV